MPLSYRRGVFFVDNWRISSANYLLAGQTIDWVGWKAGVAGRQPVVETTGWSEPKPAEAGWRGSSRGEIRTGLNHDFKNYGIGMILRSEKSW